MKSAMEVLASEVISLKKKNETVVSILNKMNTKFTQLDKDELSDDAALKALADKVNGIKESVVIPTGLAARCTDILDSTYSVQVNESINLEPKTEIGQMLMQYQSKKSENGFANDSFHAADILG
jgi:prophage DNA circulation protein